MAGHRSDIVVKRPDPAPMPNDVALRMQTVALNERDLAIARSHYHIGVDH